MDTFLERLNELATRPPQPPARITEQYILGVEQEVRELLAVYKPALVAKGLLKALEGNEAMLKTMLNKVLPDLKAMELTGELRLPVMHIHEGRIIDHLLGE
jgi:hypothetical protein